MSDELLEPWTGSAKVEKPHAEAKKWYFTFGYDHRDRVTGMRLWKRYCVVEGEYQEARRIIMERFDNEWSMVYPNANDLPQEERGNKSEFQWRGAGVEKYGLELFDHTMMDAVTYDMAKEDRAENIDVTE
jgi:hypothetical protein